MTAELTELEKLEKAQENLREAINADSDPLVEAAERLLDATEEAQGCFDEILAEREDRDAAAKSLEVRYPRLFTGDLSKLDYSDRKDLFDALVNITATDIRASDSERTLSRLDGKLR